MTKIIMQLDWYQALTKAFSSKAMTKISSGIDFAIAKHGIKSIYPHKELIFKAFELTPLTTIKAVMIGLEPTKETASGLLFESTHAPVDTMSSQLEKLYQIYCKDYPNSFPIEMMSGYTTHWAKQGVLMLNLSLTSRAGQPKRHLHHWAFLIDNVLNVLKMHKNPIAFIPFGRTSSAVIENWDIGYSHKIFSFEEGMFLQINKWLESVGREPINW